MTELWIALAPLLCLLLLAVLALVVPLAALTYSALALVCAGFVVGVPAGLTYHVLLRRELAARGPLPAGWYWKPQTYHAQLDPHATRRLMPWFLAGALGFAAILFGFALCVTALVLAWQSGVLP